ncbi:hypothetical protein BLS_004456 [Venturia inaequalis]|uniref:Uncharacterized protein n=1 Tax=Venturia inaequalis TaxID=5025 RepID=A0A8H3UKU2_VENIN|nr:hypothetical protein BLS_004456 [Venturia inaequalis]
MSRQAPPQAIPLPETPASEIPLPGTPAAEVPLPESTSVSPTSSAQDMPEEQGVKDLNAGGLFKVSPETATNLRNTTTQNPFIAPEATEGTLRRRTNTLLSQAMQTNRRPSTFTSATETHPPANPADIPRLWKPAGPADPSRLWTPRDTHPSTPQQGKSHPTFASASKIPLPASTGSAPPPTGHNKKGDDVSNSSVQKPTTQRGHMADFFPDTNLASKTSAGRKETKSLNSSGASSALFTPSSSDEEESSRDRRGNAHADTANNLLTAQDQIETLRQRRAVEIRVPVDYRGDEIVVMRIPRIVAVLMLAMVALVGAAFGVLIGWWLCIAWVRRYVIQEL